MRATAFARSVMRLLILAPACLSGVVFAQAMTAQSLEAQLNAKAAGFSRKTITRDQCVLLDTVYPDTDDEFMYAGGNALFLFAVTTANPAELPPRRVYARMFERLQIEPKVVASSVQHNLRSTGAAVQACGTHRFVAVYAFPVAFLAEGAVFHVDFGNGLPPYRFGTIPGPPRQFPVERTKGQRIPEAAVAEVARVEYPLMISFLAPVSPPTRSGSQLPRGQAVAYSSGNLGSKGSVGAFCEAVSAGSASYRSLLAQGANELRLSRTRSERRARVLAAVPSGRVVEWPATVSELRTNSDGKAIFTVSLSCGARLRTFNNAISDIGRNTLIPQSSSLFDAIANLRTGQLVLVSGDLFSSDLDGYEETSVTEKGSMTAPEYLARFTAVRASSRAAD